MTGKFWYIREFTLKISNNVGLPIIDTPQLLTPLPISRSEVDYADETLHIKATYHTIINKCIQIIKTFLLYILHFSKFDN